MARPVLYGGSFKLQSLAQEQQRDGSQVNRKKAPPKNFRAENEMDICVCTRWCVLVSVCVSQRLV